MSKNQPASAKHTNPIVDLCDQQLRQTQDLAEMIAKYGTERGYVVETADIQKLIRFSNTIGRVAQSLLAQKEHQERIARIEKEAQI